MILLKKIIYYFFYLLLFFVPRNLFYYLNRALNLTIGNINKVYCSNACFSKIKIKDIVFDVYLSKNNYQAHLVYKDLIKRKKFYEVSQITCLKSIYDFDKNLVLADLGSFVGYFSFYFSKLTEQKNKIFSIESNKSHCDSIEKGLKKNNLNNIEMLNAILSDKIEELYIADELVIHANELKESKNNNNYLIDDLNILKKSNKFYKGNSEKLDNLFNNEKPNLLKIDVHGAEGKVLKGAQNLLSNNIKYIILELHTNEYLERYSPGYTKIDVIKLLISNNFNCYLISNNEMGEYNKSDYDTGMRFYDYKDKLKYLKLNDRNLDEIFFERDDDENFILALKNTIDIKMLKCFSNFN